MVTAYGTKNIHRSRTPITTALIKSAQPTSSPPVCPDRWSSTLGSCRPTSRNSTAFSRKVRISQTAMPWRRITGVVSWGVCQPM